MAYASWSVIFGEQPSAAKWNILGSNDASFNNGTGIFGLYKNLLATDSNPYKFSVRRTAAQNVGTASTKVAFETEVFDTNNNFDAVTNNRYVAPVAGFYFFNAAILTNTAGSGTFVTGEFNVNGSFVSRGFTVPAAAGQNSGFSWSDIFQLAANDYVEVFVSTLAAAKALDVSLPNYNRFSGFLISRT